MAPHTIIFDIGNVLVGWNPRLLYRKVFATEAEVEHFMTHIATLDWNEAQDAGRPVAEGTAELVARHPEFEREIRLYYDRWTESFSGPIPGTVAILRRLHATGNYRLLALTNWSAELFPWARESFDFLQLFEDIMVSGEVKLKKPWPEIYQLLHDTYDLQSFDRCVFIDDSERNVAAARAAGLDSIRFLDPGQLAEELRRRGVEY